MHRYIHLKSQASSSRRNATPSADPQPASPSTTQPTPQIIHTRLDAPVPSYIFVFLLATLASYIICEKNNNSSAARNWICAGCKNVNENLRTAISFRQMRKDAVRRAVQIFESIPSTERHGSDSVNDNDLRGG
ncbi:uncharacterized protein EI97DRAFT_429297 [Westerdykella ornata]|uniref:Uncharacterized protein n=1 Tax=Westerdykella ornata TaxID=318751 RepID=A0A6A6JXA1_WESOR|nr:uncharacterized protein EI97DRAFT_429297 [Westerdykella ornata]KAF2281250.1 hypothetical protein EI97DRAFT_429297 [Westerdykella ornata]